MSASPQPQQTEDKMEMGSEKDKEEDEISKFLERMKELNISFINSLQNAVLEDPTRSMLPLVKDYLQFHRTLLEENFQADGSSPPNTFKSLGVFFDDLEKLILGENYGAAGAGGEPEPTPKRKIDDAGNDEDDMASSDAATASSSEPSFKKLAISPYSNPFANVTFDQSGSDTTKNVQEADTLYLTNCKIFEIVEGCFPKLRGVGILYLKKSGDNRYHVLVRADNSQGKVFLNIPLQKSLPITMKGKDAVTTVDLTPREDGSKSAIPIVIKLATWAEADKLFEKLKEFQLKT